MKEDYLWDKSGATDPEIERLENALRVFRFVETDAPALPAKIIPFERKTPRGFFRLAFAFAVCAAFVMISAGVWFQFSGKKVEVVKDSTETSAPPVVEKVSDETPITKPDDSIVETVKVPKQSVERSVVKIKKSVPAIVRQDKLIARNVEVVKVPVKLTKEEKYAYDQLMLALSVTSSTFKKVKDKVMASKKKTSFARAGGKFIRRKTYEII